MNIEIHFDGGCRGNPGMMYGSYSVQINGVQIAKTKQDYEFGTNNVAEFMSLHLALVKTIDHLSSLPTDWSATKVTAWTDSTIVRNRLNGQYRANKKYANTPGAMRMNHWTDKCRPLIAQFGTFTIKWHSRVNNVERFGH